MKMMDLDKNGTVEFHEFLEMVAFFEYNEAPYEIQIVQMFKALDKDDAGYVSVEDIQHLWSIFTNDVSDDEQLPSKNEVEKIIKNLDKSENGKIDYNDFISQFDFCLMQTKC